MGMFENYLLACLINFEQVLQVISVLRMQRVRFSTLNLLLKVNACLWN